MGSLEAGQPPVVLAVEMVATVAATYGMAVYRGDVDPLLPYISGAASRQPESCVFAQLLNLAAFLTFVVVYLRYRLVDEFNRNMDSVLRWLNLVGFWFGCLAVFGMTLVANFQETAVHTVHIAGALSLFGFGCCYFLTHAAVTRRMYPLYTGYRICVIRALVAVCACLVFPACRLHREHTLQEMAVRTVHIAGALSLFGFGCCYFLTHAAVTRRMYPLYTGYRICVIRALVAVCACLVFPACRLHREHTLQEMAVRTVHIAGALSLFGFGCCYFLTHAAVTRRMYPLYTGYRICVIRALVAVCACLVFPACRLHREHTLQEMAVRTVHIAGALSLFGFGCCYFLTHAAVTRRMYPLYTGYRICVIRALVAVCACLVFPACRLHREHTLQEMAVRTVHIAGALSLFGFGCCYFLTHAAVTRRMYPLYTGYRICVIRALVAVCACLVFPACRLHREHTLQEMAVRTVHIAGALSLFGFGCCYFLTHAAVTRRMYPLYTGYRICVIRALVAVCACLVFPACRLHREHTLQEMAVRTVHIAGALSLFGFGCCYFLTHAAVTRRMYPLYTGYRICVIRALVAVCACLVFPACVGTGVLAGIVYANNHNGQPPPHPWTGDLRHTPGYHLHVTSAVLEWTLTALFGVFLLSFSRDFEKLRVAVSAEPLVLHLDESPVGSPRRYGRTTTTDPLTAPI